MQEAQLLQRGRATGSVVENLKRIAYGSLKVIENGTIRKLWYGFLFAFGSNYGRIFRRFDAVHERDTPIQTPHDSARQKAVAINRQRVLIYGTHQILSP